MKFAQRIKSEIKPRVAAELGLKNIMAVPSVVSVRVCVGIGTLTRTTKDFSDVVKNVSKITGQKPVVTKAKTAISNFKVREGMPVGLVVTLRGPKMYDFLDRLVNIVLPRVRDFRGLPRKSFDGHGNYNIGFKEATVFPEVNPEDVLNVHGLQVTIVTSAKTDAAGFSLLSHMGFPFRKDQ